MKRSILKYTYFLFCVLATLLLVNPVSVDAGWTNLGLYGGQVYSIALDRNNTSKLFAGTYYGGGLFRTDDGGANWTPVLTGDEGTGFDGEATFSNTAVWGVQIAPSNSSVVWAVHNYWAEKSTDGGATWTHILNSTMQGSQYRYCKSLAIDPANPSIVYVGTAGPWTDTLAIGTIYKTTDGGTTWTSIGPNTYSTGYGTFNNQFPYPVVAIDIDPQNSNNIYAVSASAEGAGASSYVYRSTNGGANWTRIGLNPFTGGLQDIKVKPDDSSTIFVAGYNGIGKFTCTTSCSYDSTIYNSSGSDIRALTFQPGADGALWIAGRGSHLGIYDISGNSFNWMDIGYQLLGLAVKPSTLPIYSGDVVYGGELHRGVIRGVYSLRTGAWSWAERNNGVNAIQVWDVAVDPAANDHYLAATEAGLYERASGGTTWTKRGNFNYTSAYTVAFDPASSSTHYVGTEGRVYKTTDGGATWPTSVAVSGYVTGIAVTPSGSSYLYVTTRHTSYTSYGSVYRIPKDLSAATSIKPSGNFDYNAVVVDPNDSGYDRIFVGGGNYFGTSVLGKIYETTNANASPPTWTERLSNVIVNALLIDPNDSNKMYAGAGWSGETEVPLYKSVDSGLSWQKSYQGIPGGPSRYGLWGTSAANLYVLRHSGSIPKGGEDDSYMIRYDGSAWNKVEIGTSKPLSGIWGYDASNVFAVGESGTVVRYDGTAWSASQQGSVELRDVWGSSTTNVYAVGKAGTILRFNGSSWSTSTGPTGEDLQGIWGSSASNMFAVGSTGVILRYNGSAWSQMARPVTETLEDIWGSASNNVFAVGSPRRVGSTRYYTIVLWNGSIWSVMTTPDVPVGKSGRLRSVWGSSGTDVFAVGDDGVVLHYNGSVWAVMTSGTSDAFYGVWGSSANNVYAVGLFGTILRYNGSSWSAVDPSGSISGEKTGLWNAVTDLAFSPEGHIYAATERQGVYASANGAKSWINLSAPPYSLYAVAAGSVISGGSAGGYSLSGEGLLYGFVTNMAMGTGLYDARVNTDIQGGRSTTTETDGSWAMFHPGGTFNVTASRTGFTPQAKFNVPVYGGTWTQVMFGLSPAAAGPAAVIGAPSISLTRAGPVTYSVTYTEADAVTLANPQVTVNKTSTANGTVDVSGTGSIRTVSLSGITGNGTIGISIAAGSAYDHAGNPFPAAGPSATFTADNAAPTGVSAGANQTKNITFTQTGTATDTNAMTYLWTRQSGPGPITFGTATALPTTISASTDGTYTIRFTATDAVGNGSFSDMTLAWDATPPTIAVGTPSTTLTKSGPVAYTVTYTGADSVTLANTNVTLNKTGTANGTVAVTGTGTGTCTATISGITGNGTLGITIAAGTAVDTAGNLSPAAGPSATFTADNTAPNAPAFTGPASTSSPKPTWAWTTGGGNGMYRYKLDSGDLTTGATETAATTFVPDVDLPLGLHTLFVQERDAAGNWSLSGSFVIKVVIIGDIDGNDTIDLRDAILVLKIISALPPGTAVYNGADVDGDERIGTTEIIYILQRIAQLRD